MALNDVTFIRGEGGLGRPLPGEDHVSGLVQYIANANLPAGFSTSDRIKTVFSIAEAEALGIIEGSATLGVLWYHINEYFRIQPEGELYVGLYDTTAIDLSVIELVQTFANGRIRQIGVFNTATFATAAVTALQASATTLEANHMPLQVLYAADISATSDLSTLTDLRTLNAKNVSVIISEDGGAAGAALAVSTTKSVTTLGATLGAASVANVNESIAWVAKFNMTDGVELNVINFANGDLVQDSAPAALAAIKTKGYVFMRSHVGLAGTYHEDSDTAIVSTSDYAFIENNRTIDKAVRGARTFMLPNLSSPILVNADGTLTEDVIATFKNDVARSLDQMEIDGEISAYKVIINPAQNVLTTSKVVITVQIVPVGVARQIKINIGFTVSV